MVLPILLKESADLLELIVICSCSGHAFARNEAMNSNFGDTFVYSSPNPEEATFGVSTLKCLVRVDGGSHYYDSDVILMRYADELLMIAECGYGLCHLE